MKGVIRLFLICLFLGGCQSVCFAQKSLKVKGEVEVFSPSDLDSVVVTLYEKNQVLKQIQLKKSQSRYEFSIPLNKELELQISKTGYFPENIDVNTFEADTNRKLWPVYIKTKLRPDSLPQILIHSLISYDSLLSRFDHKNVGEPILIPTQSSVATNNNPSNKSPEEQQTQEDTLQTLMYTYEELKKIKDLKDQNKKSASQRGLTEDYYTYSKEDRYLSRKLDVLSEQIQQRILQKKEAYQKLYINLLEQKELELDAKLLSSKKKRKLIEEIAETEKSIKIKERNYQHSNEE